MLILSPILLTLTFLPSSSSIEDSGCSFSYWTISSIFLLNSSTRAFLVSLSTFSESKSTNSLPSIETNLFPFLINPTWFAYFCEPDILATIDVPSGKAFNWSLVSGAAFKLISVFTGALLLSPLLVSTGILSLVTFLVDGAGKLSIYK